MATTAPETPSQEAADESPQKTAGSWDSLILFLSFRSRIRPTSTPQCLISGARTTPHTAPLQRTPLNQTTI
jgi:hypothetical protein